MEKINYRREDMWVMRVDSEKLETKTVASVLESLKKHVICEASSVSEVST